MSQTIIKYQKYLILALGAFAVYLVSRILGNEAFLAFPILAIDDFGEQFAAKTLRKLYSDAVFPSITNDNYKGEIEKPGDRVNILQFLHDILIEDYVAGTDMTTQALFDTEDQLVINQQKSYNFAIDKTVDLFTYVNDAADALVENAARDLERVIDAFVLSKVEDVRAGNWVGINFRVVGDGRDTHASIATTAAGGTLGIQAPSTSVDTDQMSSIEIPAGTVVFGGFSDPEDVGKPIRLTSGASWATEWYRITAVTDSTTASIVNWDDATVGEGIPAGDILRGLAGGVEFTSDKNGDGKPIGAGAGNSGWGWEFQAAGATTVSAVSIYDQLTELAQRLDFSEIPDSERHITLPPQGILALRQSAELQPSGIEMLYTDTVINGRVARAAGFDIHTVALGRLSTKVEHLGFGATASSGTGAETVRGTGKTSYALLANHKSFLTFAYKWSENRTVDAENQFAKKWQGLHLYGAKVPTLRRKAGAVLFTVF